MATCARCGEIHNNLFTANFQENLPVKEFWRADKIWQNYDHKFGEQFLAHPVQVMQLYTTQLLHRAVGDFSFWTTDTNALIIVSRQHCSTQRWALLQINTKNCSLSIVLTATDQKPQKSFKRWYYPPSHCLNVNMMLSNMTFLMIFAVLLLQMRPINLA